MKLRYPPSPTGLLHVGTLRTCLFNFLYAKKNGGDIIFRSEDTDKSRSTKEFEQDIINGLTNLGLMDANMPVFRQSERTEVYSKYLSKLIEQGKAYYCFMTQQELEEERNKQIKNKMPTRYSGKFRNCCPKDAVNRVNAGEKAVIRLKVPENELIEFNDLVKGKSVINSKELDDFVIARAIDDPLYHITVVVDDHEMGITHVLRGEDHISNTPKQILLYRALGWDSPEFGHFPLILNEDRSKLSKRKNRVSVQDFLDEGYLPEALINFMALLGWNTSDDKEIFSLDELIEHFDLKGVNNSGAIFDVKKLDWINSIYVKNLSLDELSKRIKPFLGSNMKELSQNNPEKFYVILKLSHDRMKTLKEVNRDYDWYFEPRQVDINLFPNEKMKVTLDAVPDALKGMLEFMNNLDDEYWTSDQIKEKVIEFIKSKGQKNSYYMWPLRVALTREQFSPNTLDAMELLGKEESIRRTEEAIQEL